MNDCDSIRRSISCQFLHGILYVRIEFPSWYSQCVRNHQQTRHKFTKNLQSPFIVLYAISFRCAHTFHWQSWSFVDQMQILYLCDVWVRQWTMTTACNKQHTRGIETIHMECLTTNTHTHKNAFSSKNFSVGHRHLLLISILCTDRRNSKNPIFMWLYVVVWVRARVDSFICNFQFACVRWLATPICFNNRNLTAQRRWNEWEEKKLSKNKIHTENE